MEVQEGRRLGNGGGDIGDLIVVHETVWAVHVLHIFGDVDLANAAALEWEIQNAEPAQRLVIDLSNCNYLDGAAMRMLAHVIESHGDAVRIVSPAGSAPERAVRIAQMDRLLHLFPSFAAALQW